MRLPHSIIIALALLSTSLSAQHVGVNTTTPEGTLHITGASSIPFPNLRITDTSDNFARIKMETTLSGDRFWDIAGSATPGFSFLNFYFQNDTLGKNIFSIAPEQGQILHTSLTPWIRTVYYANGNEYQGQIGYSQEHLYLLASRPEGQIRLATRNFTRMTIDTVGKLGLGTLSPEFLADFRSKDNFSSGGELQLSTPSETNFLRLFGGRLDDPHPFIAFNDSDTFHLVTTSADWSTYRRRMTVAPNGFVGLGTDKPLTELDIMTDDVDDGAKMSLSNLDNSHFVRLFSGRENIPVPILFWNHGDALEFGMSSPDETDYMRFLSFDGKTIGVHNTGESVFIGEGAGAMDDGTDNFNIAIGDSAMTSVTSGGNNIAIGKQALEDNLVGFWNIGIGYRALREKTSIQNIAIGSWALSENAGGYHNIALGLSSMQKAIGSDNIGIGEKVLYNNAGQWNIAIGSFTLNKNTSGNGNTAVGDAAMTQNVSGGSNVAVGQEAMRDDTTGSKNVVIGVVAMANNQDGNNNTVIGQGAGAGGTSYDGNVLIGYQAGLNESNSNRLYIENSSSATPLVYGEFDNNLLRVNGRQDITGELNIDKTGVALRIDGQEAIWSNGSYFSYGFGTGYNIFGRDMRIGPVEHGVTPFANLHVVEASNDARVVIESHSADAVLQLSGNTNSANNGWTIRRASSDNDMEWRYNNIKKLELTDFGNLGLGVSSPTHTFEMLGTFDHTASLNGADNYVATFRNTSNNNTVPNDGIEIVAGHTSFTGPSTNNMIRFSAPNGNLLGRIAQNSSSSVSYLNSSDVRLKDNITPTEYGLDEILKLEVRDYYWKKDTEKLQKQTGFIAQQVYESYPPAAHRGSDDPEEDPWAIAPMELIPLLVQGMQDQQEMISALQQEVNSLKLQLVKSNEEVQTTNLAPAAHAPK